MWTASVSKRITADHRWQATIIYTSDDSPPVTVSESFNVIAGMTDDYVVTQAAAGIDRLVAQEQTFHELTEGNLDDAIAIKRIPPPPPPPPEKPPAPDPAEVAKQDFLASYRALQQMQRAVAGGLLKADDAALTALQASVKAAFLPEYKDSL